MVRRSELACNLVASFEVKIPPANAPACRLRQHTTELTARLPPVEEQIP